MNFKLGMEYIDKDMDITNIILKIRQLNNFMKTILDTDQRKLLKLRSSKFIRSDCELDYTEKRKYHNKRKMLYMYVDNLRTKTVDSRDVKLLQLTGLKDIIEILKDREN